MSRSRLRHKRWLLGLKASQPIPLENSNGSDTEFAGIDPGMEGENGINSDVPMNPAESSDIASLSCGEASEEEFTGINLGCAMESSGDAGNEADDELTPYNRSLHSGPRRALASPLHGARRPPPKFDLLGDLPPSSPPTSSEVEFDSSPTLSLPPRHYRDPPGARGTGQNFPARKILGPLAPGVYDRPNGTQSYNRRMGLPQSQPHDPTPGSDSE